MTNTLNSISVLILPSPEAENAHTKSAYKTKSSRQRCYFFIPYEFIFFKQQYAKLHEMIFILEVDFDQYFLSECSIQNQYSPRNIGQNQPQKLIFFHEITHTTV